MMQQHFIIQTSRDFHRHWCLWLFQQVLLEMLYFSDDTWVAQSKEGLHGSSLCPEHITWILAKMVHFLPHRVDWILGNT